MSPSVRTNSVVAVIATTSHLAWAITFARNFSERHAGKAPVLIWIGAPESSKRLLSSVLPMFSQVLSHTDIVHPNDYRELTMRYTPAELCFALKPRVLRKLLQDGFSKVLYFDTDIALHHSLDAVYDALDEFSIVLTPHLTEPLPEDNRLPRDITILRAGAFNLGFIGVSNHPEARRFLDWWAAREWRYGYVDTYRGWGGDQKWCDLVPGLFDEVGILRNAGLNVGYWNLHSRPLSRRKGAWFAGNEPLVFFHFSGFDPGHPQILSKFQDRIDPANDPLLAKLLSDYGEALGEARREAAAIVARFPEIVDKAPPPVRDSSVENALPPESYAVEICVRPSRLVVEPGEIVLLDAKVSNHGNKPLPIVRHSDGQQGIGLTFHLSRADGTMLSWENPRQYFADPVPAGSSSKFEFRYRAPGDPGRFLLEFDLVHEGHCWFKDKGGATAIVEVFAGVHDGAK
jgi:hypothetical protein